MYIVQVFVQVKPDYQDKFIDATIINAKASILEPGIARFDVLMDTNDPNSFVLLEVYRTKDDPAKHKKTDHYMHWKNTVEDMIAVPRTKKVYENIFPGESGWD